MSGKLNVKPFESIRASLQAPQVVAVASYLS